MHENLVTRGNAVSAEEVLGVADHLDELQVDAFEGARFDQEGVLVEGVRVDLPLFARTRENGYEKRDVELAGNAVGVRPLGQTLRFAVVNGEVVGGGAGVVHLDEQTSGTVRVDCAWDEEIVGVVEALVGIGRDLAESVGVEIEFNRVGVDSLNRGLVTSSSRTYRSGTVVTPVADHPGFNGRLLAVIVLPGVGPAVTDIQRQILIALGGDLVAEQDGLDHDAIGVLIAQADDADTLGQPEIARAVDEGVARLFAGLCTGNDGLVLEGVWECAGRSRDGFETLDPGLPSRLPVAFACPRTFLGQWEAQKLGHRSGQIRNQRVHGRRLPGSPTGGWEGAL